MKCLIWSGLFFLSVSWLFFIPIFNSPNSEIGVFLLAVGILCNTIGLQKSKTVVTDKKYLMLFPPLLISFYLIHYPYNIGLLVLMLGLFLHFIVEYLSKSKKIDAIPIGMSFSGIILMLQAGFFPIYAIFVSHGHRVDFLSPIISMITNLFGLNTAVSHGIVFVQTFQQVYPFTTTWEKLGFFPWFNMLIGSLLIIFLMSRKRMIFLYVIGFFIIGIVYFILRYVFFIYIFSHTMNLSIFWNPFYLLLSFIPLTLLLTKLFPLDDVRIDFDFLKYYRLNRSHILTIVMVFLFLFSTIGVFAFQDPGNKKSGRILIDEFHSEWEDTTKALDKEWYGVLSTYNYYSWAEWLDHYYSVSRNTNKTLTTELLNDYDILILKCPTNGYSDKEIKDITLFVENGGGLFLIGDHTNVFGMNTYLNQISEEFGIKFKTDATYELGTGEMSTFKPNNMFLHPIVQHIEEFNFLTSCTLQAPLNSENVIIGNKIMSEPGTYSTENFFRESINTPECEYGLLLQATSLKYGKGRVVAFSDSTCFSSFCVFTDGYKEFSLGAIDYLNRYNIYSYINAAFSGVALITFFGVIYLLKKDKKAKI
ncbi:MAG: hypothetical protein DRO67_06200, partial [Candidatus Asgardarchaeum californiense]